MLTEVQLTPPGIPGSTRRTRSHRQLGQVASSADLIDAVCRERLLADRTGKPCSVAVFKVEGGIHTDTIRVAWSVLRSSRATDLVGTLDDSTVCAILPDTASDGADAFCAAVELDPAVTAVTYWWTHQPENDRNQPDPTSPFQSRPAEAQILLPWFIAGIKAGLRAERLRSIAPLVQTQARIGFELGRAQRSKWPLTAVVVRPADEVLLLQLARMARRLLKLKRRTDFVGRLDGNAICLLLPDTDTAGARRLADQILSAGKPIGSIDIHAHTSGWFSDLLPGPGGKSTEQPADPAGNAKVGSDSVRSPSVQITLEQPKAPAVRATVWPAKYDLLGVEVTATDYDETVQMVAAAARRREPALLTFLPVHGIVTAAKDPGYCYRVNAFDLVAPDGMPVRWAINHLHKLKMPDRVCGPEAMTRICRRAAQDGISIYLYGSTVETLEALRKNLVEAHPGLIIAGIDSPPFRDLSEDENHQAVQRINDSGAGMVFIGLGCPRQDYFAYHNRNDIRAVQLCVGAAFDFHAGLLKRPPLWMQRWGLEWTYRLTQEPRRLFKRYMVTNTAFVWMMGKRICRGK